MPALRMLGRKWLFASDDLVFPSIFEIPYRIFWLVMLSVVVKNEYHTSWQCNSISDGIYVRLFLYGILAVQAVSIPTLLALAHQSARGTITDSRKLVVPLLLFNMFIILVPELMLNIMGSIWLFSNVIHCSLSNPFSNGSILAIVILTWIRLILILITIYTMYDPLGGVEYEDLQTPAKRAWYNKKLTKLFTKRLKWALLILRQDKHSKDAIEEISRLLAALFRSTDLVLSDLVAGSILLRIRQKRLSKQREDRETEQGDDEDCTDISKTFADVPPWMNLNDAYFYLRLSTAAYGWFFVLYKHLFTGLCALTPYLRCCCCRPTEPEVEGDNCCMCNYAGLKKISKVEENNIIYVTFASKVFEVPYFVIVDHERKNVVITIRGTISLPDVFTDLASTGELFEAEGLPAGTRAHRGMAMGATKAIQQIMPILEKTFQEYPDYGLVVTGHSLGAGMSILLGILLKPKYPQVKVFAFSAPSGLLSREASRYTESFVMTVGLGDDVVMRLGLLSVEEFRDKLMQALNATRLPKYRILLKGVRYAFTKIPDSDLESVWKTPEDLEAELLSSPVMQRAFPETDRMYNAGRILHITRRNPADSKAQKRDPKYDMAWTTPEDYRELLVTPRMLLDHLPDGLHDGIKWILGNNSNANEPVPTVSATTQ